GACGTKCADDQTCVAGECRCRPDEFDCSGGSSTKLCVDIMTDPYHCGGCQRGCQGGQLCIAGVCREQCAHGKDDCNGSPADGCETNIDSDPENCGACGNVCDGVIGQPCVNGKCVTVECTEVPTK